MTFLSVKDDFLQRTLANVSGRLGKLAYVSELRENDRYVHWGLTRIYGDEATQRALREVHRALFLQVLRTPLRQLVEDVVPSAAGKCVDPTQFVESLVRNSTLLPPEMGGGSLEPISIQQSRRFPCFSPRRVRQKAGIGRQLT